MGKLVGYIQLVRPFTLLAPFLAGIFGVLTPVTYVTLSHFSTAVYVGLTLALAQATGQVLNQYVDVELDRVIKSYRPIVVGLISRDEALGVAWLLAFFAFGRGFTISISFGLTVLTLLFFAVFYSLSPFSPRKIHPVLNVLWMAVSRGFLPMYSVWSIYGGAGKAWEYSLLAFIWVLGFQSSKDITDVEGDKKFDIKTIPSCYGVKGLLGTMILCSVLYTVMAVYYELYLMLILGVLGALSVITLTRNMKIELTENTVSWIIFYAGLGLIYILMYINELLVRANHF